MIDSELEARLRRNRDLRDAYYNCGILQAAIKRTAAANGNYLEALENAVVALARSLQGVSAPEDITSPTWAPMSSPTGAAFSASLSLYEECNKRHKGGGDAFMLSAPYPSGHVDFLHHVARIGRLFEAWSETHVDWLKYDGDCWPYMLHDRFGLCVLDVLGADQLMHFEESHCALVAAKLVLPLLP